MTLPPSPAITCPACSAPVSGRFCGECGASVAGATCADCAASLGPGAKFCHHCGRPASGRTILTGLQPTPATGVASSLPWIVASVSLVMLLAFFAGNAFNKRRGSSLDAPQNALPQAGLDDRGSTGGEARMGARAPDISALSPQERAERLFNRVMILNSQGKTDSVLFFAPMAITAYQMLAPMSADQRYDMGRIAEVAGALPLAKAQADTILQQNPTHLLGLILGASVAKLGNDAAARRSYEAKLLSSFATETTKKLPEYERHEDDITNAMATVRSAAGTAR